MWKKVRFIFLILISVIGMLVFWQWDSYTKPNGTSEVNDNLVEQEIIVKSFNNEIRVTHKLNGLTSNKEYNLIIPNNIFRFKCIQSKDKPCDSNDANPTSFLPYKGEMQFEYIIPINRSSSVLLHTWTVKVKDVTVTETNIEFVDPVKKGTWIAGLPLKGHKEHKYINYSVFNGEGETPSIYWDPKVLNKEEHNGITFYTNSKSDKDFHFDQLKKIKNYPDISVLFTDRHKETVGKGLIIVHPDIIHKKIERKLITHYYEEKFNNFPSDQQWIVELFSALSMNELGESRKVKLMIKELREELTDKEIEKFLHLIQEQNRHLSTTNIDKIFSEIKGLSTDFFTKNKVGNTKFISAHYFDSREVEVLGEIQGSLKVMKKDDNNLFPFIQTVSALGYDVQEIKDKKTYILNKSNNRYEFYINKKFFKYNGEDFGLLVSPLNNVNEKIYMEQQILQTLFKVEVVENQNKIILNINEGN